MDRFNMQLCIIIIILCGFMQRSNAGFDCVERCLCKAYEDMAMADCSHLNWTRVPQPTGPFKVEILHLENNQIRTVSQKDFIEYVGLHELNLTRNALETLENSSLSALTSLRKLDLSHNNLQAIAKRTIYHLKHNLTWFSVANNHLKDIPAGIAEFDKLMYLDISRNIRIKSIHTDQLPLNLVELNLGRTGLIKLDANALGRQKQISEIHLDNMLSLETVDLTGHKGVNLHPETFSTLPVLKRLVLKNCNLTHAPALADHTAITKSEFGDARQESCNTSRSDGVRWYNPKLNEIDLSDNLNLLIFPGEIIFPPSLLHIKLSYTTMPSVDHDFLRYASKVETLDLQHAGIVHFRKDALMCLGNLKQVNISENQLFPLPDMPHSVEILSLSHLNITSINQSTLEYLSRVTHLDLNHNEIRTIEDKSFGNMTELKRLEITGHAMSTVYKDTLLIGRGNASSSLSHLDMSRGLLRKIENGSFSSHGELRTLLLHDNALENIGSKTFEGLKNLRMLNLASNDILDIFDEAFSANPSLQVLHLEHNRIHVLLPGAFKGLQNLQELHVQFNELTRAHKSLLPALQVLDISGNRLKALPEFGGVQITLLNASFNPLSALDDKYFLVRNNVKVVNLSSCNLEEALLGHATSLQTLDLTRNQLKSLPNFTLPSLTSLHIGGNRIQDLSEKNARNMRNLSLMDMRGTNFTHIDPKFFDRLKRLETFMVNRSYLPCTCDMREFGKWAISHADILTGNMLCYWPPKFVEKEAIPTINALDCYEETHAKASSHNSVYIAVAVASFLLVILIVFLVRAWCKRTSPDFESEQTEGFERFDGNNQCCNSMSPLKCCLQARENVYSRSRMRLFSNDDSEFVVSPIEKSASSA